MKAQDTITDEIVNKKFTKLSENNRLRLVLETLNYNGVLYTVTSHSSGKKTKSRCYDRSAS